MEPLHWHEALGTFGKPNYLAKRLGSCSLKASSSQCANGNSRCGTLYLQNQHCAHSKLCQQMALEPADSDKSIRHNLSLTLDLLVAAPNAVPFPLRKVHGLELFNKGIFYFSVSLLH